MSVVSDIFVFMCLTLWLQLFYVRLCFLVGVRFLGYIYTGSSSLSTFRPGTVVFTLVRLPWDHGWCQRKSKIKRKVGKCYTNFFSRDTISPFRCSIFREVCRWTSTLRIASSHGDHWALMTIGAGAESREGKAAVTGLSSEATQTLWQKTWEPIKTLLIAMSPVATRFGSFGVHRNCNVTLMTKLGETPAAVSFQGRTNGENIKFND